MGSATSLRERLRPWSRSSARAVLALAPLGLFLAHATGVLRLGYVDRLEGVFYDERVRLTMPATVDPRIVIVDIDDLSLATEGHWPWRRDKLAALINRLIDDYAVRVVGFDVLFAEPDESTALELIDDLARRPAVADVKLRAELAARRPAYDTNRAFAESMIARDVVLGYVFKQRLQRDERAEVNSLPKGIQLIGADISRVPWISPAGYIGNLAELQANASFGGFFDEPLTDDDGIVRRLPLVQKFHGEFYPSLGFACAWVSLGMPPIKLAFARDGAKFGDLRYLEIGAHQVPVDRQGAVLAPFRGPAGSFPYASATHVLRGTAAAELLKDAIVLVGSSAPGLNDLRSTPVSKEYPGVEAHANLISGILDGTIRFQPSFAKSYEIIGLILIGLLAFLVLPRLSPLAGAGTVIAILAAVIGINLIAWTWYGAVLPLAALVVFTIIESIVLFTYGYFIEQRRKRHLSRVFSLYIPGELVRDLDENEAEVSLAGDSRDMSVLFSDVRGFTTISEGLEPRALTQLMNEFLTPITAVIQIHRGTIDKYMGDAVMAFWGAPVADRNHAEHAVLAALDMIARMRELGPEFRARGWPELAIGVGVSSGVMNVGNMGSQFRTAYTVLGDVVNLGSRLESLTKYYGVNIIVSANTAAAATGFVYRELDLVRVKGKNEPIAIYEPLGLRSAVDAGTAEAAQGFALALATYRAQRWDEAEERLTALSRFDPRTLYTLYRERVSHFRAHGPGPAWDGVWVHENK
jgi:adenylate cyclase